MDPNKLLSPSVGVPSNQPGPGPPIQKNKIPVSDAWVFFPFLVERAIWHSLKLWETTGWYLQGNRIIPGLLGLVGVQTTVGGNTPLLIGLVYSPTFNNLSQKKSFPPLGMKGSPSFDTDMAATETPKNISTGHVSTWMLVAKLVSGPGA